jgi:hypothetical protein
VRKGEAWVDGWTAIHVASGAALGALGTGPLLALAALVAYEAFEGLLRRIKLEDGGLFEYESWGNIVVDVLAGYAGALAALGVRAFVGAGAWSW